ncbi:MAG: hypothetical protein L0229_30405 [Blastocatellia bacterium]|nr:hypothetical protein [Blastocatellia bacterium]
MKANSRIRFRVVTGVILSALVLTCSLSQVLAQDTPPEPPPIPVDPTPIGELLNANDRELLRKANNEKKQVETYLKISDAHLDSALTATRSDNIMLAERELDIYNKALAEAGRIAFSHKKEKDRRRLAKKVEQHIYKQIRTLETIERLFPVDRLPFAQAALENSKRLRLESLNETFDSGEVLDIPDKGTQLKKDPPGKKPSSPGANQFLAFSGTEGSPGPTRSQIPGDYLNEEEDDMVRQAQKPDDRTKVFMKIADRRLVAIKGVSIPPGDKKAQKKAEEEELKWGPLPKLERFELFRHYTRAIEETIAKLEDAHERNPKDSALPKALTALRDSTDEHLRILRSLESEIKDEKEASALKEAIAQAEVANQGAREGLKSK